MCDKRRVKTTLTLKYMLKHGKFFSYQNKQVKLGAPKNKKNNS